VAIDRAPKYFVLPEGDSMTPLFMLAAFCVIVAFCAAGAAASGKVRSANAYEMANRRAGPLSVTGIVMGALVAGGSTIGTVQMAYLYGLSGWWFTLGSGIGCLVLGLWFARPVRRSGLVTLPQFIERQYGAPTALLTLAGSSLGTLLSIIAQFIAGVALLQSVFPVSRGGATAALSAMILAFIFTGGLKSFSVIGNVKTAILYLLLALCTAKTISLGFSPNDFAHDLAARPWFGVFERGVGVDVGACVSLLIGVLCTQIYMQAVFAARDEGAARMGCLVASVLIPPLGLMGVWIGSGMRASGVVVDAAQALPFFLNAHFSPAVAGALWAGLAITVVGGAAGLTLGVATNLSRDLYMKIPGANGSDACVLRMSRGAVVLVVAISAISALALKGSLILQLSYVGMGLRGAGMFLPLIMAIFHPGALTRRSAFFLSTSGLGSLLLAPLILPGIEPLFVGLAVSALCLVPVIAFGRPR
jgi:SSS family solute:Na+ symporter